MGPESIPVKKVKIYLQMGKNNWIGCKKLCLYHDGSRYYRGDRDYKRSIAIYATKLRSKHGL